MKDKINTALLVVLVVITLIIALGVYKGGKGRYMLNPENRGVFDTQTGRLYYYYKDDEGGWYSIDFLNREWVKHSWENPEESIKIPINLTAKNSDPTRITLPDYAQKKSENFSIEYQPPSKKFEWW